MSDASAIANPGSLTTERRLRLWPGVAIVAIMWLVIKVPGWVDAGGFAQFMGMYWGGMLGAAAIVIWWLFASRARWADRGLVLLFFVLAATAAHLVSDSSIQGMGMDLILIGFPWASTAWVAWLLITPTLSWPTRRIGLVVVILLAFSYLPLVRMEGVDGSFAAEMRWRWSPSAEDEFLAERAAKPTTASVVSASAGETLTLRDGDWPAFRGPDRDGHLKGVRIATDWKQKPLKELWRHRVGPGWGSFCVVGSRAYTQEQRGEDEVVVCYDAASGKELWNHTDQERFKETVSGAGPRATPTFYNGKIYALGAKGRLNCLDAVTGARSWSRDVTEDSGAKVPTWGFSASPLVIADIVTVFTGGESGKSVAAYRAATGEPVWSAGDGKLSYCSTHPANIHGVEQVLIATDEGVSAFDPSSGNLLWQHSWPTTEQQIARVTQPTVVNPADVLIGTGMGVGTRLIRLSKVGSVLKDDTIWTTKDIKPYFNDLVVFKGAIYGFDGPFFTCVGMEDGKAKWRERGYGSGQVLLLEDQGLLLILSEKGEVALVEATPERRHELAKFKAIEGKTWNHPAIAHGKLFIRNGEEAACYQLREETDSIAARE
jgi:outer membrane protein assembly factor BamB